MSPLYLARAIYAYTATNDEELTIGEDDPLQVFEKDDEWLLVKLQSTGDKLGYVPASYVQEEEGTGASDAFGGSAAEVGLFSAPCSETIELTIPVGAFFFTKGGLFNRTCC